MNQQIGYVVYETDSVGTALCHLHPGGITLLGEPGNLNLTIEEDIPFGHKFALREISAGDPIVKYGARIGTATEAISRGHHIHLHNIRSDFDERAATLDSKTAEATDTQYTLNDGR